MIRAKALRVNIYWKKIDNYEFALLRSYRSLTQNCMVKEMDTFKFA